MTEPPSPLRMLLSRHTKRREFITLLGGAAAAWTRAAADDAGDGFPTRRITGFTHMAAAFRQGVKEKGSIDGHNVTRRA